MSIICIFLFVPFSVKGQEVDRDDPLEEALRWERVVYSSDDPAVVKDALVSKAACLARSGSYGEALRTLDRIRMYLLSPEDASEILMLKSLYSKRLGDNGAALGFLEESGSAENHPALYSVLLAASRRFAESHEQALRAVSTQSEKAAVESLFKKVPRIKKEGTAAALSFIPPAGQIYLGRPWDGLLSMLLNVGAAGFTAFEIVGHDWVTGLLGGGLLLNETFLKGNISKNIASVEEANELSVKRFSESLEELLKPGLSLGNPN